MWSKFTLEKCLTKSKALFHTQILAPLLAASLTASDIPSYGHTVTLVWLLSFSLSKPRCLDTALLSLESSINKLQAIKHFEFLVRFSFAILFLREKQKKKWCFVCTKKTVEQLQSFTLIKGIIQCLKAGVPLSSTNFFHKFKILDFLNSESLLDVSCIRSYSWTLVMVWTTSHEHNARTFWGQK